MKDWGLSFQNKKSAKIFFKILKEGIPNSINEDEKLNDDLLGKRDDLWTEEEEHHESEQGKFIIKLLFLVRLIQKAFK